MAPHREGPNLLCPVPSKGRVLNFTLPNVCGDAVFQLMYLKIAGMLFPTSDLWHPVVTPALVCMSQLLTKVHTCWCMAGGL